MTKKYREGFKYFVKRKNGNTDWIDLSSLPKTKTGNRIKWREANNNIAPFSYGDVEGSMYISYCKHINNIAFMTCEYNKKSFIIACNSIQKCSLGNMLETINYTHEFKKGDIVSNSKVLELIRIKDSSGKNLRAYKMLCLESNMIYKATEGNLKRSSSSPFVAGKYVYEENSLYSIEELRKYFVDKNSAKNTTRGSRKMIMCKCPKCFRTKDIIAKQLSSNGFSCVYCSNKTSYPERLMTVLLTINDIEFVTQKRFNNLKHRIFDFYIPSLNTVVETHGEQHYKVNHYFDFERTKNSDNEKKEFCKNNGINYIEVDCSKSDMNYILQKIHIDFIKNKDEKLIAEMLKKMEYYDVENILKDYNSGLAMTSISSKYNISYGKINNLLKRIGVK